MIRKSGWLVFLVVCALIFVLVYFLAGFVMRVAMVYTLEKAAGAEVNIDGVALRFMPLSVTIDDLQMTDKNRPTHNTLSFDRAHAALELWPALLGYYVVNDLSVDGLAYGRERSRPGKVYRGELADDPDGEQFDLSKALKLDLPDMDELLKRVDLKTPQLGQELAVMAAQQQQKLDQLARDLPDKKRLEQLQASIKELTDSKVENAADLAAKLKQLRALQDEVRAEQQKLRAVQTGVKDSREALDSAVAQLREANSQDLQRLKTVANIRDGSLAPISQILLGDYWGKRISQLETVYRYAKPYLPESTQAADEQEAVLPNRILPLTHPPYPNFWVKNASIGLLIGEAQAQMAVRDITAQHDLIGGPTRFNLDVANLPRVAAMNFEGDFAIGEHLTTNAKWQISGFDLNTVRFGGESNALTLEDAVLETEGTLTLVDDQVQQQAKLRLQQPKFDATDNKYLQQLSALLNKQPSIPFSISATGEVTSPAVSVNSSLDKVLSDALLGEARQKVAQLEADMRARLERSLAEQLQGKQQWAQALSSLQGETDSLEASINEMLTAEIQDVKSSAAEKIKESLFKKGD